MTATKPIRVTLPELHAAQVAVQVNPARFKVVAAGRRWGKGVLGIGECVKRASMAQRCWWLTPSFASAAFQSGWRMLEFYRAHIPGADIHHQRRTLTLPGGGWVQFKTSEEPDSLRGEGLDFVVCDEWAHTRDARAIWELRLRPTLLDRKGAAWFISTPSGFNHFSELFNRGRDNEPGWASFQYPSSSNPFLDARELEDICKDMPALVKRQEMDAEFVQLAGALFKREAVKILDAEPSDIAWVRSWDLAFTTKTTSDFTVGLRAGAAKDGTLIVADVVRGRWEWPQAMRVLAETAKLDGGAVRQGIEVVGAQIGALQTLLADPMLCNLSFEGIQVHADKVTRALPVVARCEQGKLAVVRGAWTRELLDELSAFPESAHDDQCDALSGAVNMIAGSVGAMEASRPAVYSARVAAERGRSMW